MAHRFNINHNNRIIELEHYADVDMDDINNSRARAITIVRETGYNRLLINMLNRDLNSKPAEEYNFAKGLPSLFPALTRIAVVISEDDPNYNKYRFAENVSYNNGFLLRIFHSRDKAVEWLGG